MLPFLCVWAQASTLGYHHQLHFDWNEAGNALKDVIPVMDNIIVGDGHLYGDAFFNATENESNIDIGVLTNLAKSEYGPALYVLGELNLYGLGMEQNFKQAAKLFKRAAKRGFNESLARLSFMYKYGLGVSRDSAKSVLYRKMACDSGSLYACMARANSQVLEYDETLNAAQTIVFQYAYLEFLKNNTVYYKSEHNLPVLGDNMTFDEPEHDRIENELVAGHKYKAEHGDATSEVMLGVWYLNGEHGLEVDVEKAKMHLLKHQDHPDGAAVLGVMHLDGLGFPKDIKRAKQFFEKSARLGSALGKSGLGATEIRLGNKEAGEEMIREAAIAGNVDALHNLALMELERGRLNHARLLADQASDKSINDIRASVLSGALRLYGDTWDYDYAESIVNLCFTYFCPRADWADAAKKLWEAGNRQGAVLIWMELLEIGDRTDVYRALKAIINCEEANACFLDESARNDLIIKLAKFSKLINNDIPDYVFEKVTSIYELKNEPKKASAWFSDHYKAKLTTSAYWHAKSMLLGRTPMNLSAAFWDLAGSMHTAKTPENTMKLATLLNEIASRIYASILDKLNGTESPDWENIYDGIIIYSIKSCQSVIAMLVVLIALIALVRKRVEVMYNM